MQSVPCNCHNLLICCAPQTWLYLLFVFYFVYTGILSGFDPRQRQEDFSSNLFVQTGSVAQPASCPVRPGVKAGPGRDAGHSSPSSAEVMNE
jgi:hypothetical protein